MTCSKRNNECRSVSALAITTTERKKQKHNKIVPAHFRSCMTIFKMAVRFVPAFFFPWMASISRIKMSRYNFFCIALIPVNRMVSCFGGSDFSTSAFNRRSINGRRILCNCEINLFFSSSSSISRLNHSSNCSALAKTSGTRKLSNAQSSWSEFCRGVLSAWNFE